MATKNTKKTSTRVSKKSKGPSTKLKIWVGVLIVLIVAVVGVVVVRFSQAGSFKSVSRNNFAAVCATGPFQFKTLKVGSNDSCVYYIRVFMTNYHRNFNPAKSNLQNLDLTRVDSGALNYYDNFLASYVRDFQRREGLAADGIIGTNTWIKIMQLCPSGEVYCPKK